MSNCEVPPELELLEELELLLEELLEAALEEELDELLDEEEPLDDVLLDEELLDEELVVLLPPPQTVPVTGGTSATPPGELP